MKTKLKDLNEHLFEEIEKLLDDEICSDPEKCEMEVKKAKVISDLADNIIEISNTQLRAIEMVQEYGLDKKDLASQLAIGE